MPSPSTITFDDSLWPLLVVRFAGTPTDEQFGEYLARRQAYLDRKQKHVLIYDTVRFQVLTHEQRQRQIDWIKARADTMKQLSLGSALIITSPVARMTLSIVLHFSQAASRLHAAGLVKEAQRVRTHYGLNPQHSTA